MKTILLITFMALSLLGFAQNDTIPLQLTKQFFKNELKNYQTILAEKAKEQLYWHGRFKDDAVFEFETLHISENEAVIATFGKDKYLQKDVYTFWTKDEDSWKIIVFKEFWIPILFRDKIKQFDGMGDKELDSTFQIMFNNAKRLRPDLSREEIHLYTLTPNGYKAKIKRIRLIYKLDKDLIAHFNTNKTKFIQTVEKLKADEYTSVLMWELTNTSKFAEDFHQLLVSKVWGEQNNELLTFIIAQAQSAEIGYLYCENLEHLPKMTPTGYIMIRNLGDGWYYYKRA